MTSSNVSVLQNSKLRFGALELNSVIQRSGFIGGRLLTNSLFGTDSIKCDITIQTSNNVLITQPHTSLSETWLMSVSEIRNWTISIYRYISIYLDMYISVERFMSDITSRISTERLQAERCTMALLTDGCWM